MRQTGRASLAGILLLLCGMIVPFCTVTHAATDDLETQRNAALARINQWRAAIGVAPLARHPALAIPRSINPPRRTRTTTS
ncbi:MAG: hypothetical protein LC793_15970 [Thermomicrobia bacterium]|nr:hypothetical protein [Thermomicrobia bacterium]